MQGYPVVGNKKEPERESITGRVVGLVESLTGESESKSNRVTKTAALVSRSPIEYYNSDNEGLF